MKRVLAIALAAALLLGIGGVGLALWRPSYLIGAAAMVSPKLAVQWFLNWRERLATSDPQQQLKNLENEVVRVEIDGRKYNVPMRYLYWDAREKKGRWPQAKPDRVKTKALSISVLLPDLRPYYPEDDERWKVLGHGDRLEVTFRGAAESSGWYEWFRRFHDNRDRQVVRPYPEYGLDGFDDDQGTRQIYFPADGTKLVAICDSATSGRGLSPSCMVKSSSDDVVVEYYYGTGHLQHWRDIDRRIKTLVDGFLNNAAVESTTGEK